MGSSEIFAPFNCLGATLIAELPKGDTSQKWGNSYARKEFQEARTRQVQASWMDYYSTDTRIGCAARVPRHAVLITERIPLLHRMETVKNS